MFVSASVVTVVAIVGAAPVLVWLRKSLGEPVAQKRLGVGFQKKVIMLECASEEFVGTYRLRSKVEYLVADPARCRSCSLRPNVVVCFYVASMRPA